MLHLGNGMVLTFDENNRVIRNGGVVVEGETILALGETARLREEYPGADFKDAGGRVIMPGMINAHTHLYSTFARGMSLKTDRPPVDFTDILEKLWWRLDRALTAEDIYYSALYGLLDCIKRGTTVIIDHHASYGLIDGSLGIIGRAVEEAGIRADLCFEVSDRHGPEPALAALRENERFIKQAGPPGQGKRIQGGMIGLHASFTLGNKTLDQAAALADQLAVPFHVHTAEGSVDVEDSRERGYSGVVERLDQYHIWRPGTLAIHGVHLKGEELLTLKSRGACLIHNPESNIGNAVGIAPVRLALMSGLRTGMGTDGYSADLFSGLKVASLLQKHQYSDPGIGMDEVYQMGFAGNRQIISDLFGINCGKLGLGRAADLIVLDYSPPTPINGSNCLAHLIMGMESSMVETTMVSGRILMENREVRVIDEERVCARTREQAADFWARF